MFYSFYKIYKYIHINTSNSIIKDKSYVMGQGFMGQGFMGRGTVLCLAKVWDGGRFCVSLRRFMGHGTVLCLANYPLCMGRGTILCLANYPLYNSL